MILQNTKPMNTHLIFNPARAWQLLSNDFQINYKRILIGAGALFGILLLIGFVFGSDGGSNAPDFHYSLFPFSFIAIGLVLTSFSFREMNSPHERQFYLSLPATNLEKFLVRWFEMVVLYPLFYIVLYYIFSLIFNTLTARYFGSIYDAFQPFSINVYVFFRVFLIAHSIFFLGAIAFQKYNFFKTAFFSFGLFILSVLIFVVLFRITFASFFGEGLFSEPVVEANINDSFKNFIETTVIPVSEFLVHWILPLFLWFVAYLKLTEKEL